MAYVKLFASILQSTIWLETSDVRIVWITMLAMADRNGEVQGSVPGLAKTAGVPLEVCRSALEGFLKPDPDSRTEDDEGRRIEKIDGGWALLNYAKYRRAASLDEQTVKNAERQNRFRARRTRNASPAETPLRNDFVTVGNGSNAKSNAPFRQAEAEAEAEAKKKAKEDPTSSVGKTPEVAVTVTPVAVPKAERPRFRPTAVPEPVGHVAPNPPAETAPQPAAPHGEGVQTEVVRVMPPDPDSTPENALEVAGVSDLDMPAFLDRTECGAAVRVWNEVCERTGWPQVKKLSSNRRAQLTARLKDVRGVRGWAEALALAEKSPFLRGKTGRSEGHENWQCNFDFLIKESKFLKLIEGGFNGLRPGDKRLEGLGGVLAGLHRAAAEREPPRSP